MDSTADVVPRTLTIKTGSGVEYHLHEPSLEDIEEGERLLEQATGTPQPFMRWLDAEGIQIRVIVMMIWLASRRHGLTSEHIAEQRWATTIAHIKRDFKLQDFFAHIKSVCEFFGPAPGVLDALAGTSPELAALASEAG